MRETSPTAHRSRSDEKLREAMLYVAHGLAENGDPYKGAVKLNKVLWRADFESYRRTGTPVTGTAYQRLAEGPAPVRLVPVRNRLVKEGHAHLERVDIGAPRPEEILVADRPSDTAVLSEADMAALDEALDYFFGMTGTQCSDKSHQESAGWKALENKDEIPYETAIIDTRPLDFPPGTTERVRALLAAHDESTKQSN